MSERLTSDRVVEARELSKTYKVYHHPLDRLLEAVTRRPRHRAFEALKNVGFELERGESLGIVGENGAGKSTLLKILSGVTQPTRGQVRVRGRIASLLELGMGFHPELSGRQNIRLNAAMMGFGETEIQAKTPEIIDFSELDEFIDRPIKTYSSGMAMRLAFGIAVQVEPDVLIIDEALSVGDGYFQKKCMDRIRLLLDGGCTFLFCSHAMYYVSAFCQRALWLRRGEVEAWGPSEQVIRQYESFLLKKANSGGQASRIEPVHLARITRARLWTGGEKGQHGFLDRVVLEVGWRSEDPALAFQLGVGLDRNDGLQVASFSTLRDGERAQSGQREYRQFLVLPELPIQRGHFDLYLFLLDEAGLHVYDQRHLPDAIEVSTGDYAIGLIRVDHRWQAEVELPASAGENMGRWLVQD